MIEYLSFALRQERLFMQNQRVRQNYKILMLKEDLLNGSFKAFFCFQILRLFQYLPIFSETDASEQLSERQFVNKRPIFYVLIEVLKNYSDTILFFYCYPAGSTARLNFSAYMYTVYQLIVISFCDRDQNMSDTTNEATIAVPLEEINVQNSLRALH